MAGTKSFNIFYHFDGPDMDEVEDHPSLTEALSSAKLQAEERLSYGATPVCELCQKTEINEDKKHCDGCSAKLTEKREGVRLALDEEGRD